MNIMEFFPSKYVKADDLKGQPVTLTIQGMRPEVVGGEARETKPVLYFEKATKGLILNKINAITIAHLYSAETDNWPGKRITIYPTNVKAFGKSHHVIRVRDVAPPPLKTDSEDEAVDAMMDSEDVA